MGKPSSSIPKPSFRNERSYAGADCACVAGVDEAGRGPWAGPVVAAAVVFENPRQAPKGLADSKLLSADERARLHDAIRKVAVVGVGIVEVEDIDSINILQATFRAMQQAVSQLTAAPEAVLVDGNLCPPLPCRGVPIVDGDQLCPSIAAASIIAKVTRDRMMVSLAQTFPGYSWETNKGYGTREHASAIVKLGVTPHHRKSFAPIKLALGGRTEELALYRSRQITSDNVPSSL
jgi:ribonuclease HII